MLFLLIPVPVKFDKGMPCDLLLFSVEPILLEMRDFIIILVVFISCYSDLSKSASVMCLHLR